MVQLVLVIVFGEDRGLRAGYDGFLSVHDDYALLITRSAGRQQLASDVASETPENLVRCVVDGGTCFSQVSSPPFLLDSRPSIHGS